MVLSKAISFKNCTLKIVDDKYYEMEVFENTEFGFEDLRLIVEAQKEMGGLVLPVLVVCGKYASVDIAFLNHLSKNANSPYVIADAFILSSMAQKLLANFYLKIIRPERPTKYFYDRKIALNWLEQYM